MFTVDRRAGRALVAALLITFGAAGAAHAQPSPQARAKSLNDEGKALLFATPPNYDGASMKFRQAIVLSPEGRFYFNLCVALYQQGDFGNALMACQAVAPNGADDKNKKNASDLIDKIKQQMKNQGMNPDAVPNGTPNGNPPDGNPPDGNPPDGNPPNGNPPDGNPPNGNPPNGNPPIGANPAANQFRGAPPPSLFAVVPPKHDYTYTLGAALVGGAGSAGAPGAYNGAVGGVRLLGDLLFSPATKVGGEGYIDILNMGEGDSQLTGGMTMADFGVGIYKHFCTGRMCLSPMIGAHVVTYQPASHSLGSTDYASVGVRLQASAGYAFGSRYEHFITANLGVDLDAKPLGTYDVDPSDDTIGLDSGAAIVMLSIGYQYRFNTPFGQSPFVQLE